jgi:predicted metalloprotease
MAVLGALAAAGSGCGGESAERLGAGDRGDSVREKVDQAFSRLARVLPEPPRTEPVPTTAGHTRPETIDQFLTAVIEDVDGFWTRAFKRAGLPAPHVGYEWIPPGVTEQTACGPADDNTAAYCPADDTMRVAQSFAARLYAGVLSGLPGEQAGFGHAAGDFAVAYVIAHEYAHNLQSELGIFDVGNRGSDAEPFELQADCLAGVWTHSAYQEGELDPGDIQEGVGAALAVGDFDVGSPEHHGTPVERADALVRGFRSGDPGACRRFVPEV